MWTLTPEEQAALLLSLRVAFWAMIAVLPFALALAWVLARTDWPGKWLLDVAVHLPLVLPPVVTGYLLLIWFGRRGPIGAWLEAVFGIVFSFKWTGAVLACAIMSLPLAVNAMRLALENVDRRLELAAATLGARPVFVFATITLPLALPGVLAGMVLAFARSLGEFGATITFVSNIPGETQTAPSLIHALTQVPNAEAAIMRLCLVSLVLAAASLALSNYLSRRLGRVVRGE
jgi:molybdate transport system permease protein